MNADPLLALIGKITLAGAGVSAIATWVFKTYSVKWLDARFAERLQSAKAQLDKEIHRAQKLADREFDAITEAWAKLNRLYDQADDSQVLYAFESLEDMSQPEFEHFVVQSELNALERAAALSEEVDPSGKPRDRNEHYSVVNDWYRARVYGEAHTEYMRFLSANRVFMPEEIGQLFFKIGPLLCATLSAFWDNIEGASSSPNKVTRDKQSERDTETKEIMQQLERLIHARFWSVSETSA